jgi:hypothetical protein
MKYAVEIGSGVMTYIPSFINIGSGIQNFMKGGSFTHTQCLSHKPTFIFSKKK